MSKVCLFKKREFVSYGVHSPLRPNLGEEVGDEGNNLLHCVTSVRKEVIIYAA